MRSLLAAVATAWAVACHPAPDPVEPGPGPHATACEAAHARAVELGCEGSDGARWVETCQAYEAEAATAPALSWRPTCMASAPSCPEQERCRGGAP